MGINNISGDDNEPRLTHLEVVYEVLHHLLSIGLSGDSLISAEQTFDETNPDDIVIKFSYYDKVKGVVTDTITVKGNDNKTPFSIEDSLKGIDNIIHFSKKDFLKLIDDSNYRLDVERQRIDENLLAIKLSEAIKSGKKLSNIDDPKTQGRLYPYKNPINPDDKFSK